jgi:hypothetical protein
MSPLVLNPVPHLAQCRAYGLEMVAAQFGQTSSIGVPSLMQYVSLVLAGTARSQVGQIRYVLVVGCSIAFATAASLVLMAVCNNPGQVAVTFRAVFAGFEPRTQW